MSLWVVPGVPSRDEADVKPASFPLAGDLREGKKCRYDIEVDEPDRPPAPLLLSSRPRAPVAAAGDPPQRKAAPL